MRPIGLRLSGFRTFRAEQTIEFSNLGLFAVVGNDVVGQTSILDAIVFALYNACAHPGDDVRSLIERDASAMSVAFTFAVGAASYVVVRSVSRSAGSPSSHSIRELARAEPYVFGESGVDAEILRLTGISYREFVDGVVSMRERLAELLIADGRQRERVLDSLLGLREIDAVRKLVGAASARSSERSAELEAAGRCSEIFELLGQRVDALEESAIEILSLGERFATAYDRSKAILETCVSSVNRCIALACERRPNLEALETSFARADREAADAECHIANEIATLRRANVTCDDTFESLMLWTTFRAWCEATTHEVGDRLRRAADGQHAVRRLQDVERLRQALEKLDAMLARDRFQAYVARRRERSLLAVAADVLHEMSDGRYVFAERFAIVDARSRARRDPSTLSGGEQFLASVALAFGLAEVGERR